MTDELKACPFCGLQQLTDEEAGETLPYQGETRICDGCGCVAHDWNTRPIEVAQAAEIERLHKELLERDAIWLPEKDAEIGRLSAVVAEYADHGNWGRS